MYVLIDKANIRANVTMRVDLAVSYNYAAREWEGGRCGTVARLAHVRGHDHRAALDYIQMVCPG
ncbi:hypothetical protein [Actinokineospora inagensis]|uniref:hypothetical protein n=1 Tax=Actinokineospora inagensis TaxID=103730 RepID=UPI0004135489|nr:hypothetical protein [Actinokineospora inagensis]